MNDSGPGSFAGKPGFHWAFEGEPGPAVLRGPDDPVGPATIKGMPEFLRKANQLTELMILAGPGDAEIGLLRQRYGYRPEAMIEVEASRLEWEASYMNLLADHPASRAELRVRLQARELLYGHLTMYTALIREYDINLSREAGYDPDRPNVSRRRSRGYGYMKSTLKVYRRYMRSAWRLASARPPGTHRRRFGFVSIRSSRGRGCAPRALRLPGCAGPCCRSAGRVRAPG